MLLLFSYFHRISNFTVICSVALNRVPEGEEDSDAENEEEGEGEGDEEEKPLGMVTKKSKKKNKTVNLAAYTIKKSSEVGEEGSSEGVGILSPSPDGSDDEIENAEEEEEENASVEDSGRIILRKFNKVIFFLLFLGGPFSEQTPIYIEMKIT